jgi:hypothetical protein
LGGFPDLKQVARVRGAGVIKRFFKHPFKVHKGQFNQQTSFGWKTVPMETLEFIIYPDGRVQEKVTGIIGSSCAEVTAAIEALLGEVVTHQPTSEYFAQQATLQHRTSAQAQVSQW